jgi:hypothetical protein
MEVNEVDLPAGRYGGRLGSMAEVDVFGVIGRVKPLIVSAGITDGETYERAMIQARADLDRWRCTLPFYIAYGQKPMHQGRVLPLFDRWLLFLTGTPIALTTMNGRQREAREA